MPRTFDFADAWWFRGTLRLVVLAVSVFALLSLSPALLDPSSPDHGRALFGIAVLSFFVVGAVLFMVSINDSYVVIDDADVIVRFEGFFNAAFPVEHIVAVTPIDPRPRWRYRWGLATNFRDRISCSHGGKLVEIALAHPVEIKLWPRTLHVTRFWLAVRDHRAFTTALHRAVEGSKAPSRVEVAYAA